MAGTEFGSGSGSGGNGEWGINKMKIKSSKRVQKEFKKSSKRTKKELKFGKILQKRQSSKNGDIVGL
jgi:hypothetical protein